MIIHNKICYNGYGDTMEIKLKRIASQIVREVSDILSNVARDRLMHTVTITGCDVSSDLSYAKVYFTVLDDAKRKTTLEALNNAASFIRGELSKRVEVRHTPELKFFYDTSIDYGKHIEEIIEEINNKE